MPDYLLHIFLVLLCIHIACGFISLVCSLGAMISPKGYYRHRRFGTYFFYGMTGVFITAIPMAIMKHLLFLFLIAIFSYYLAFSGRRYARNRLGWPAKIDWVVSCAMLFVSAIMILLGIYHFNLDNYQCIVLIVFGVIGGIISTSDLKTYRMQSAVGRLRIAKHLSAMLGATIAAITAFSVTNLSFKPEIVIWLGPTVLLVPVIIWWKSKVLNPKSNFDIR